MGKNNYQIQGANVNTVAEKFEKMGARVKFDDLSRFRQRRGSSFTVDVRRDKKGEYFDIRHGDEVDISVIDIDINDRHLLLMAKIPNINPHFKPDNIKVLCGHDEREWFSSQVSGVSINVDSAKQALKPDLVIESQKRAGVKTKNKHKRKNKGFIRQGEWFFIPVDYIDVPNDLILKKEPLMLSGVRAGNKPHMAEFAFRRGGEQVYVPNVGWNTVSKVDRTSRDKLNAGLTNDERKEFYKKYPEAKNWGWRPMVRNPELYVRGNVRHPDHKTIKLRGWHRVVVNGEIRGENVVFLD